MLENDENEINAISTVITIRVFPGGGDWEGGLGPGLDPSVEAHGNAVDEVGEQEAQSLIPGDHRVGDSQDQDDDADQVAEAVPKAMNIRLHHRELEEWGNRRQQKQSLKQ